jgi:hypothetical protein
MDWLEQVSKQPRKRKLDQGLIVVKDFQKVKDPQSRLLESK